jgi:hypothetical protein
MTANVSHEAASLLEEALALPLPERSYLAERLLVSLDDEPDYWRKRLG